MNKSRKLINLAFLFKSGDAAEEEVVVAAACRIGDGSTANTICFNNNYRM